MARVRERPAIIAQPISRSWTAPEANLIRAPAGRLERRISSQALRRLPDDAQVRVFPHIDVGVQETELPLQPDIGLQGPQIREELGIAVVVSPLAAFYEQPFLERLGRPLAHSRRDLDGFLAVPGVSPPPRRP